MIAERVLFRGVPCLITRRMADCVRVEYLVDDSIVPAGTFVIVDHDSELILHLDRQVCGNCHEPLRPAFDFQDDGPDGWLHADGAALCVLHAAGPPGIPWDLIAWPTATATDGDAGW